MVGHRKNTFLEGLLPELKKRGLRVAVVKHDAHSFDIDREDKDTGRLSAAGADVTAIFNGKKAAFMENRPLTAEEAVGRVRDVDVIITEGCKTGPWRKIALMRAASGKPLPVPEEDCFAIITDAVIKTERPFFKLDDYREVADFIIRNLKCNMMDNYGRIIRYLRNFGDDLCNLRCCYCMPAWE
jgi:molybdopterin-guanine dinucleotide biosynthesis protein MobB